MSRTTISISTDVTSADATSADVEEMDGNGAEGGASLPAVTLFQNRLRYCFPEAATFDALLDILESLERSAAVLAFDSFRLSVA